jgi:hypothetical protein
VLHHSNIAATFSTAFEALNLFRRRVAGIFFQSMIYGWCELAKMRVGLSCATEETAPNSDNRHYYWRRITKVAKTKPFGVVERS